MVGAKAVVLGASMAGLLAARVLAEFYESVTVVERDELPDTAANRRGPLGRHAHALLAASLILGDLFPGFEDELVAAGVPAFDYEPIGVAWRFAISNDLSLPEVEGRRSLSVRLGNSYAERLLTVSESDNDVAEQLIRVTGLIDPPIRLFHPKFMYRVARARPPR